MTEEKEIQEYKDLLSEKILSAFPEQPEPAEQIDNLLEIEGLAETLRISQIDIIDILSQPTLDAIDVDDLIKEYGIQQNETRPRRTPKDIEERLKPYGISNLLWKQYHDDHYDAFDFPLVPKRSLSIPIDNGLSGAWAPNGYGKTFVFARILKILQAYQHEEIELHEDKEHELFLDFLTKCIADLHHSTKSTIPLPYDGHREETSGKRLIPFRQICFSVEALKDNHTTDFFSVRIEIEYDSRGNVSNYSLHLLAPNVANIVVVEGNIKLPNWINSNYPLEQISHSALSTRGGNYSKWPGIALRKLLSLNVNYIEIPSLAYQPNAGEFVQENIKAIVNTLLDEFTSASYPDIEIDKHGLLATFSKEGGKRFLLEALNELYNGPNQEEAADDHSHMDWKEDVLLRVMDSHGIEDRDSFLAHAMAFDSNDNSYLKKAELETAAEAWNANASKEESAEEEGDKRSPSPIRDTGIYALQTLIDNIQIIESEINSLVNNDNEAWGIEVKIRTPIGVNALDIIDNSSKKMLPWAHLSFGQRNDLILTSTLAQYQHCYNTSNTKDQVVLVIDEPEAGRSESWVNQLMHKLSTHISPHPILVLSHRGMVLESINSSGEYQIMHTVTPDIDEVEQESFKEYGILQSEISTKAKQSFALISALGNASALETMNWVVKFPKTITPTEEWMEYDAKENQWILKPTIITEAEAANIIQFVNKLEDQFNWEFSTLLLELWNGRTWKRWPNTSKLQVTHKQQQDSGRRKNITTGVKGIHFGGLGLPQTPGLNFLLRHLPTHYPKSIKDEQYSPYRNKTIKELAKTKGLKLSNTRISNVRKIIALAEQNEGADRFSTNLHMFIAGLKVRLNNLGAGPKMPKKDALQAYISQLETQADNPMITQVEEIEPETERGFFDNLKTLGVIMPEQTTQQISENPISITDLEDYKKYESILTESIWDKSVWDKSVWDESMPRDEFLKNVSAHKSKILTTSKKKFLEIYPNMDSIKTELRLRDKEKHPTQANFDTTKYRWTQKTLIASIKEAEINDYAEELVLHLASRYVDQNDLDPDEKIWIRADAFKEAARKIADRDVSSRYYDDFDDECGQYMLIRADIHGYSCLTCNNMYDEKKFLI